MWYIIKLSGVLNSYYKEPKQMDLSSPTDLQAWLLGWEKRKITSYQLFGKMSGFFEDWQSDTSTQCETIIEGCRS